MIAPPKKPSGVKFTSTSGLGSQEKLDITILLLANPRAGSQLARKFTTDYPPETTKLLVRGGGQMISCRLRIFDVTDRNDKTEYFQLLEQLTPASKRAF